MPPQQEKQHYHLHRRTEAKTLTHAPTTLVHILTEFEVKKTLASMLPLISNLSIFPLNPSHHGLGIQPWRSTLIPRRSSPIPGFLSPIRFSSASVYTTTLSESFLATRSIEGGFVATEFEEGCKMEAFWPPYLLKVTTKDLVSTGGGTCRALAGLGLMVILLEVARILSCCED